MDNSQFYRAWTRWGCLNSWHDAVRDHNTKYQALFTYSYWCERPNRTHPQARIQNQAKCNVIYNKKIPNLKILVSKDLILKWQMEGKIPSFNTDKCTNYISQCAKHMGDKNRYQVRPISQSRGWNTVIPRLTKIIRSGITFVSQNMILYKLYKYIIHFILLNWKYRVAQKNVYTLYSSIPLE